LDLFSKLSTIEYLTEFRRAGFELDSLILEVNGEGIRFRDEYPKNWQVILAKNPTLTPDDLLIKANFVRLKKPKLPSTVIAAA
jgi:hypothetical protein